MAITVLLLAILLPAPAHAQLFVAAFGGKQVHQDADLALTLEYKMTRVHVDAQVVDGRVDVVFRTHQFALGLGLSFPEHCILEENPRVAP